MVFWYFIKCRFIRMCFNEQQECKVIVIVKINSNEPLFYPFSIKTSKCSGSCNNINDNYAKLYVPNVVKSLNINLNIKVFNLMPRANERSHIMYI